MVQGHGAVLRASLNDDVTLEYVQKEWHKITDMSKAKHMKTSADAMKILVEKLEYLGTAKDVNNNSSNTASDTFSFGSKDLILYALGSESRLSHNNLKIFKFKSFSVGATVTDPSDLQYLYENHQNFTSIPSFFVLPGLLLGMSSSLTANAITHTTFDLSQILHGEQYLEVMDTLPMDGVLTTKSKVIDVQDKKSGALVVTQGKTNFILILLAN